MICYRTWHMRFDGNDEDALSSALARTNIPMKNTALASAEWSISPSIYHPSLIELRPRTGRIVARAAAGRISCRYLFSFLFFLLLAKSSPPLSPDRNAACTSNGTWEELIGSGRTRSMRVSRPPASCASPWSDWPLCCTTQLALLSLGRLNGRTKEGER